MKRTYTAAQLKKKTNRRAARHRKTTREVHPTVINKIYTLRIISPMQCVDSVNDILKEEPCTITRFGETHIIVRKLDEKTCNKLATSIRECAVKTPHGRTFKPIVSCEKYKDVTPKAVKPKKPSNNTIEKKIAAKDRRKFSNVCRNTNRYAVRLPRRTKKLISLLERRNTIKLQKTA